MNIQFYTEKYPEYEFNNSIGLIRIGIVSQYFSGSSPICNHNDAIKYIIETFGKGEYLEGTLTYAISCFRVALIELLWKECNEMWKDKYMNITDFSDLVIK